MSLARAWLQQLGLEEVPGAAPEAWPDDAPPSVPPQLQLHALATHIATHIAILIAMARLTLNSKSRPEAICTICVSQSGGGHVPAVLLELEGTSAGSSLCAPFDSLCAHDHRRPPGKHALEQILHFLEFTRRMTSLSRSLQGTCRSRARMR